MINVRKMNEIYHVNSGWFQGQWHFSFGGPEGFYDPENTSFGALRVFNVDTLVPGVAWPLHSHRDIEVITYILDGQFQHGDQNGRDGVLRVGDVQHTTVGKGMLHEEVNYSEENPMTFLQIWVMPCQRGLEPAMEQRHVDRKERLNRFLTLVSNKADGALPIQQDAEFLVAALEPDVTVSHELEPGWGAYFYVASGSVVLNGSHRLAAGDAAKITEVDSVEVQATEESELAMVVVQV